MDKNILKVAMDDDTPMEVQYNQLMETLKKKGMNFSRILLSIDSKIAYVQIIPKPIKPIRGIA